MQIVFEMVMIKVERWCVKVGGALFVLSMIICVSKAKQHSSQIQ